MGLLPVNAIDLRGIPMQDTLRRVAGGSAAAAVLALSPLAFAAPAHADEPKGCPAYAVKMTTDTSVTVSPNELSPGEQFTATATVTTDGVAVAEGSVRFKYANQRDRVDVDASGTAETTFTAKRGRIQVNATYTGQCLASSAAVGTSRGRATVVAGVEAHGGGNGNGNGAGAAGGGNGGGNGVNRAAALAGVSGLGSTGFDSQTELLGLLGLGLVGAGGITLVARRRSHG